MPAGPVVWYRVSENLMSLARLRVVKDSKNNCWSERRLLTPVDSAVARVTRKWPQTLHQQDHMITGTAGPVIPVALGAQSTFWLQKEAEISTQKLDPVRPVFSLETG